MLDCRWKTDPIPKILDAKNIHAMSSYPVLSLEEDDLTITQETADFIRRALKQDLSAEEVRDILFKSREAAYKALPYPCIRHFHFVCFFMQRNGIYKHVIDYARKAPADKAPVVMDLGCCMGTDLRKLVQDGYPTNTSNTNVYGCDLQHEFVVEGHSLYRDGPDTKSPTPIKFFADDVFTLPLRSETNSITSTGSFGLKDLIGKIDILYAGALFHLFDEEKQVDLARRLITLINVDDGVNEETIIFGRHRGSPTGEKGIMQMEFGKTFCHSASSWKELWQGLLVEAFGEKVLERLRIEAVVEELDPDSTSSFKSRSFNQGWLFWSISLRRPL